MRPGVRADGMPSAGDLLGDVGIGVAIAPTVKKVALVHWAASASRMGMVKARRAVVEGQDDLALLQQRRRRVLVPE